MSKVNFQALGTNVLIKAVVVEETTEAGIILPDSIKKEKEAELQDFLEVISIGADVNEIKVGDSVMLSEGKIPSIELEGEKYLIVYQGRIIGKKIK